MERFFQGKRIVIYGIGNTGRAFFGKYASELSLEVCTCSDEEFEPIEGMKGVTLSELDKEKDYLVICSAYYREIYDWLIFSEWEVVKNFVRWDVFEEVFADLGKRKIAIFCGQCEMDEISICMRKDRNYSDSWSTIVYSDRDVIKGGDRFNIGLAKEIRYMIRYADCFIQGSAISPATASGYQVLRDALKEGGKVIKVSLFDFDSYWPQDIASTRTISPFYLQPPERKIGAYCERDQYLENLVLGGDHSVKEILDNVCSENCFDPEIVWKNHKKNMMRVNIMDRVSDVKIFDFVDREFKKNKLYCDRGHFNTPLMQEYAIRLLKYIQAEVDEDAVRKITMENTFYNVNEFPIYPCTAAILGLEWIDKDTEYRMLGYNGLKRVTFKEYMDDLITYYSEVKRIKEL